MLLDDKVDLEVPLDDLAVHEPDARKLIAFLKAMEFSTLTRRVAEYSQIDPSMWRPMRATRAGERQVPPTCQKPEGRRRDFIPGSARRTPSKVAGKQGKATSGQAASPRRSRLPPHARKPRENCRSTAASTRPSATPTELKAWIARATDAGHFAIDALANTDDPMQADICGIALALAPNDACYVPLAHRQSGGGAGLFDAGLAPDQIKASDALAALKPLLKSSGILKIGFNIKFNAVMLAQHGITMRNVDDAQLMSYALEPAATRMG